MQGFEPHRPDWAKIWRLQSVAFLQDYRVGGAAAFLLGAPAGLVGNLARTPSFASLPFRLVVPVVAFIETSMRLTTEADGKGATVVIVWHAIRLPCRRRWVGLGSAHGLELVARQAYSPRTGRLR